ncbi:MAG: AAA family ATPase [Parcubacteria group bacterium]|nr:AAA family ATPase [Parcubacteria group bacterium]
MRKEHIPRIALDGGVCSGKTEGCKMLLRELPKYGVTPFVVPELATHIFTNGVSIAEIMKDSTACARFQRQMVRGQLQHEQMWHEFAALHPGTRKVLICDRGVLSNMAYNDPKDFRMMLRSLGLCIADCMEARYDAVIHLVTAAEGAEAFYNLDNPTRHETALEAARTNDARVLAAWTGHEHLGIINNFERDQNGNKVQISFKRKMELLLQHALAALGVPDSLEIERKFLVILGTDPNIFPVHTALTPIKQVYLFSGDKQITQRVRERKYGAEGEDGKVFVFTEKKKVTARTCIETERIITLQEYRNLLKERDPRRDVVRKCRYAFVWEGQYFQLDVITHPKSMVLLEIPLIDEDTKIVLPPFVSIVKEVTGDKRYSNSNIAAGKCPGYKI